MTKLKYLLNIVLVLSITLGGFAQGASKKPPDCSIDPKLEKLLKQMIGNKELASVIAQSPNALTSYAALEKDEAFDDVLNNPKALRTLLNMPRMNAATNNEKFGQWYDGLTDAQFDEIWKNELVREALKSKLRHPGGEHEWCMVCEAPALKKAGITFSEIQNFRTKIEDLVWKIPDEDLAGNDYDDKGDTGGHGVLGTTRFHNELRTHVEQLVNAGGGPAALATFRQKIFELGMRWQIGDGKWEEIYNAIWK